MEVVGAREAVLLQVGRAGHLVDTRVIRLEDGAHRVVVRVRERVVFVVVAFRAVHREAEEGLARVLDHVVHPGRAVEEIVVACEEAGGAEGGGVGGREFVAGELLDHHAVVALVGIERFHDPVAPVPDVLLAVPELRAEAPPVAVTPEVHEVSAPALAVVRAGEQALDDGGAGAALTFPLAHLLTCSAGRWESERVNGCEGELADERR